MKPNQASQEMAVNGEKLQRLHQRKEVVGNTENKKQDIPNNY